MGESDLKQKAVAGIFWTGFQKYSTMFVQFLSGIILARLLTPHDYGCIGMLTIFTMVAEAFIDGGFGSALIQKKNPTQEDYSTIFFWNLGMAAVLYVVLFFSSPAIARFYDIPILCPVLRVNALILFIYAFNLIQNNQLRKKLNFKFISIVSIVTCVVALLVTIVLAYNGFGVWALVAQNLITGLIPMIAYWFLVKWRPIWTFSVKSFRELFSFGAYMLLSSVVSNLSIQLQGLLIGKCYSSSTLGYYTKGVSTESLISHSISSIMDSVAYPLYSQAQDDLETLRNMVKRLSMTIAYITVPILFILMLVAKPVFVLLYSDRWIESVPYFQCMCLAGMAACLLSVNAQTISAIGKSKQMFVWTLVKAGARILLVVLGMLIWGIKGLLVGVVISNWVYLYVNMLLVAKYIGYSLLMQIKHLSSIFLVSALAAGVSYFVGSIVHLNMYVDGILKICIFVSIYLFWSIVLKPEAFTFAMSSVPDRFRKVFQRS